MKQDTIQIILIFDMMNFLQEMGYKYSKTGELVREQIIQSKRIQEKIKEYLVKKAHLQEKHPESEFFWLDETFFHQNDFGKTTILPIRCIPPKIKNKSINRGIVSENFIANNVQDRVH